MRALALMLALLPGVAVAEPKGDLAAFDACVLGILEANADNFMAPVMAPITCGDRHVPVRQSCTVVDYMLLERRPDCEARDLAFWQAEVARLEAEALADGRGGVSSLLAIGLERCAAETAEGPEREACLRETYWREAMGFQSALAQVGR